MNMWVRGNFLKEEPALLTTMDTRKVAILIVCCEKWIWKHFSEAQEINLAVSSKHQVVILKIFGVFLSSGSPKRLVLPQPSQERVQPLERDQLLGQSLNSTQVSPGQPALSGKLWVHFLIEGAATKQQGYDGVKVSFLAAD